MWEKIVGFLAIAWFIGLFAMVRFEAVGVLLQILITILFCVFGILAIKMNGKSKNTKESQAQEAPKQETSAETKQEAVTAPQEQTKQESVESLEKKEAEAVEKELSRYNQRFISWRNGFKTYENNSSVGAMYERYIGYLIESKLKTSVVYNGRIMGFDDDGVDLYYYNESGNKVIVQCKCYARKSIHNKELRAFVGAREMERQKEGGECFASFYAHSDILNDEQKDFLRNAGVSYEVIPYSVDYPKIKYSATRDKYFLPNHQEYDRLDFKEDNILYFETYEFMSHVIKRVKDMIAENNNTNPTA